MLEERDREAMIVLRLGFVSLPEYLCIIVKCGCVCVQHDCAHIIGVWLTVMVPVGLYTVCVIGLRVRSGGGISERDVAVRSCLSAAVSRQKSRPVRGGGAR